MFRLLLVIMLFAGISTDLFAAITRYEWVTEPNEGDRPVVDENDFYGPTNLDTFSIIVEELDARVCFISQELDTNGNSPSQKCVDITTNNEGDGTEIVYEHALLEGITYFYPFARPDPQSGERWQLGPVNFDDGSPIYFIVDQGPPQRPFIGDMIVQGGRTTAYTGGVGHCGTAANIKSYWFKCYINHNHDDYNADPALAADDLDEGVVAKVIYNSYDMGTSLELTFEGVVLNNPELFDVDPDTEPNPNPYLPNEGSRHESNANVAAQVNRLLDGIPDEGAPLNVQFVNDALTRTGPYNLKLSQLGTGQWSSTDDVGNWDLSNTKDGPDKGVFERLGFDFKNIVDGDYELLVGARDAASQLSPGGFVAFGTETVPTTGEPSRIYIVKDIVPPRQVYIETPRSIFIFGNTPPSVDPPYADSIFTLKGTINDERGDMVIIHSYIEASPAGSTGFSSPQTYSSNPNTSVFQTIIDATSWSPAPADPAGQAAYRMVFAPQDLNGNVNVDNVAEILLIKDYTPPPTPVFSNLADGDAIQDPYFTIEGYMDNRIDNSGVNPQAEVNAEYGNLEFELSISLFTSTGTIPLVSYVAPFSSATQTPVTESKLDDNFSAQTYTINILDPEGIDTGVDVSISSSDGTTSFMKKAYARYDFSKKVNFTNIPDGILDITLCTIDEVGNKSDPCASVSVVKDLTGPVVLLDLQESGPDDNYTTSFPELPNFLGADDFEFLVSLKSPEFAVDTGVDPAPATQDPHYIIPGIPSPDNVALKLMGTSYENFGFTTMIEITGPHIPTVHLHVNAPTDLGFTYQGSSVTISQPAFGNSTEAEFEAYIPITDLISDIPETISLRAVDNLGNWGPVSSVSVKRDVVPPDAPTISIPTIPPGFSKPTIYINTDTMTIQGVTEPNAHLLVMMPPVGSAAGFPIETADMLPRTSPDHIPITGSSFDSFIPVCANLTCEHVYADADGRFLYDSLDISTVATSLTAATTIYIQVIDTSHNTDPTRSVAEIEIHKNTLNVPVDELLILDYPQGSNQNIQVYPSTPPSPALTIFYGRDMVRLRVQALFPMVEAPDLKLRQNGYLFVNTGKIHSSFPSQLGTMSFDYTYDVLPQQKEYDGAVEFMIEGGRDLFGNSMAVTTGTTAFIVDTIGPNFNEESYPPIILTSPVNSTLVTSFVSTVIDVTDYFKDGPDTEFASGVETSTMSIQLYGPLHETPDSVNEIPLLSFAPVDPAFDLGAELSSALVTDGSYRLEYLAKDRVGNSKRFYRTFVLDRQPVGNPVLVTNPADSSTVSTLPMDPNSGTYVTMKIYDIEADFNTSDFELFGPSGIELTGSKYVKQEEQSILKFLVETSVPALDGTSDGLYRIAMDVFDIAGNEKRKEHSFIYDTQPMNVTTWYPQEGQCVSDLEAVSYHVLEDLSQTSDVSGIDRNASALKLTLLDPWLPDNENLSGTIVPQEEEYHSQDSDPAQTETVLGWVHPNQGRGFPKDGSYDGVYEMRGDFKDLAGNARTVSSTFAYDSIPPLLTLSDAPDFEFVSGASFYFEGVLSDRGPCGFGPYLSQASGLFETSIVELNIYEWDEDEERPGTLAQGPYYPQIIQQIQPENYPAESAQALMIITGLIPQGTQDSGLFFQWKVKDAAGNTGTFDRVFLAHNGLPDKPVPVKPLANVSFKSETFTNYVSNPLQLFQWNPSDHASYYELNIGRWALTPSMITTTIKLDKNILQYAVDLSQIQTGVHMPLNEGERFSWFVDAVDAGGQKSYNDLPLYNGISFYYDAAVPGTGNMSLELLSGGTYLPIASAVAFATGSEVTLRWNLPEPVRLSGNEKAVIKFSDSRHEEINSTSLNSHPVESSQIILTFPLEGKFLNGNATVYLDGFSDRAGNRLPVYSSNLKIDVGPEFEVKLFQNPVDKLSFTYVVKPIDFDGSPDMIKYDSIEPTPVVSLLQSGTVTPLNTIALGAASYNGGTFASGITGSFTANLQFLGNIFLNVKARDLFEHQSEKSIWLHVGETAVKTSMMGGTSTRSVSRYLMTSRSNLSWTPAISSKEKLKVYNNAPLPAVLFPEVMSLPVEGQIDSESGCEGMVLVSVAEGMLRPDQRVSCDKSGKFKYSLSSVNPNLIYLVKDQGKPILEPLAEAEELEAGKNLIRFACSDAETGVYEGNIQLGDQEAAFKISDGYCEAEIDLSPGKYELSAQLEDWGGNVSTSQMQLNVLRPFAVDRYSVYPNPVRGDRVTLDLQFSRDPEEMELALYDVSGKRIRLLDSFPGSQKYQVDLTDSYGRELANGVYFIRLKARRGDKRFLKYLKLAVLR